MVTLGAQFEKLSPHNRWGLYLPPLYHQWQTAEALRELDLVANTYNTGTGKTTAALLHLFDAPGVNTLFIAPTNELIRQHVTDIRNFVARHHLDFHVLGVDAAELRRLAAAEREVDEFVRNARVLHDILQNPRIADPSFTGRKPFVLVTNPDLFYLSLYGAYSPLDTRNLLGDFVTRFDYVVVDEFHYYNARQLACFLFFFALSKEFGYFDGTRKVCLLSATPNVQIRAYLTQLFGERWTELRPDNEPPESDALPRVKALTELQLTLRAEGLDDYLDNAVNANALRARLTAQDGAIISDSLARISRIGDSLRRHGFTPDEMGAIVGPAGREAREAAKRRPLLLATPTVDIGYNFDRADKPRQNLDFLYCDAQFAPELLQRLGRVGRVLGKRQTDTQGEAVAFVPAKLIAALQAQGPGRLSRAAFAQVAWKTLGEDHRFFAYLDSWAGLESYRPIYEMKRIMPPDWDAPARLFIRVKELFAPGSTQTAEHCEHRIRAHLNRERLLEAERKGERGPFVDALWQRAAGGYLRYRYWQQGQLNNLDTTDPDTLSKARNNLLRWHRRKVRELAEGRYALLAALFHFRGEEIGLRCGIYDPQGFFQSGAKFCYYDLLHVLEHYEFTWLLRKEFTDAIQDSPEWCDCYVRVDRFRTPRARTSLTFDVMDVKQEDFEREHWGHPTALKGLRLRLTYRAHGQEHEVALPPEIRELTEEHYLPCLLTRFNDRGTLQGYLGARRLAVRDLLVRTSDASEVRYQAILGTAAFIAHAELWARWRARKSQDEAVAVREAFEESEPGEEAAHAP